MDDPLSSTLKSSPAHPISLPRLITTGLGARLVVDTGAQVIGPFLSIFAAGLGVSIVTFGWLASLRSLMGLMAPVAGTLADRFGYPLVLRATLLMSALGMFLISGSVNLWTATLGMMLTGFGLFSFSPVLQSYMSAHIPYAERARRLGMVEYSWALGGILGLPLCGVLITSYGWRAPFAALGTGLLLAYVAFHRLPGNGGAYVRQLRWHTSLLRRVPGHLRSLIKLESNTVSAWSAIAINATSILAAAHVGIVYGTWMLEQYGLDATGLGTIALILGIAQLAGSVLASQVGDRLGKRRTLLISTGSAAFTYLLLPILNVGLVPAVVALLLVNFVFEVCMVSNLLLLSEQIPTQRVKVLTLASASITVGSAIGSLTGPLAYLLWGVWGLGLVASAAMLASFTLALVNVREIVSSEPRD